MVSGVLDFPFNPMGAGASLYFDKIDLNVMHKIRFLCN